MRVWGLLDRLFVLFYFQFQFFVDEPVSSHTWDI